MSFGYQVLGFGAHSGGSSLLNNLVSWWNMDETNGTRVDSHGSNNLSDTNGVGNATGKVNNAADFVDANDEYLSKSSPAGIDGGDHDFTVIGWMYLDIGNARPLIKLSALNTITAADLDWMIWFASSKPTFYVTATSTYQLIQATSFGNLSLNTWYHICAWHDSVANTLNICVNDGTIDTNSSFTTPTHQTNATTLQVGGGSSATSMIDGRLDEWAFWDRVLTAEERTEIYNSGSGIGYPG